MKPAKLPFHKREFGPGSPCFFLFFPLSLLSGCFCSSGCCCCCLSCHQKRLVLGLGCDWGRSAGFPFGFAWCRRWLMKGESDGLGIATGKASSRGHPSHFTYGVYGVLLCCTDITLLVFTSRRRQGSSRRRSSHRGGTAGNKEVSCCVSSRFNGIFEMSQPDMQSLRVARPTAADGRTRREEIEKRTGNKNEIKKK